MVRRTALLAVLASTFAVSCAQLSGVGLLAGAQSTLQARAGGIPTVPGVPNFGQQPILPQDPAIVGQKIPLTLLYTSDIHSRLLPYDLLITQVDANLGLGPAS